jgi:hypothetical protein
MQHWRRPAHDPDDLDQDKVSADLSLRPSWRIHHVQVFRSRIARKLGADRSDGAATRRSDITARSSSSPRLIDVADFARQIFDAMPRAA